MKLYPGDVVRHKQAPPDSIPQTIETITGAEAAVCWTAMDGRGLRTVRETYPLSQMTLYEPIMQFFRYQHLPEHLQARSRPFADLAAMVVRDYPRNAERTIALRKLLEAKDAAVRAALFET